MLSVDGRLQEIAERSNPENVEVPPDCSPLDFMLAIMHDASQPMQRRTRMAIAAAPYVHPKLEAHAILTDGDLGVRLDRARKRLEGLPEARAQGRLLEFIRPKENGAKSPVSDTVDTKPLRRL